MGQPMFRLMSKLKCLKPVMKEMNSMSFSNIERRVEEEEKKLSLIQRHMQQSPHDTQLLNEELQITQDLILAQKARASFSRQKSKLH